MQATSCPFPDEVVDRETGKMMYRYLATGRMERCKNQTLPVNSRLLKERSACSIAKKTKSLQGKVEYAATTSHEILHSMEERARDKVFENVDLSAILQQAIESVQVCQDSGKDAADAAKAAKTLCEASSQLRLPAKGLVQKVEMEFETAMGATSRAMRQLDLIRQTKHLMDTLYYQANAQNRRKLGGKKEKEEKDLAPFGIQDLILVDAKANRDIVAIGSPDCEPLNKCFGSAKGFNVRAKTFGNVKSVYLTSEGPIRQPGITEGIAPYSVWGDDGYGDYNEEKLKPGTYTVTARATDGRGNKSSTLSRTFTVESEDSKTTSQPSASFGIDDLILVDAKRNRDIVAIGSPGCEPLNKCFGSASRFNIRAKTFGDVDYVFLTSAGPIEQSGITEGIYPYTVWGDDGYGDYNEEELKPGTYTVTARATNNRGSKSSTFTKTFTVESASASASQAPPPTPWPTEPPTAPPTAAPTPSPTASPTKSPTASPTAPPTASPSVSPTPLPTASPTSSPTESPTTSPSSMPTSAPSMRATAAPSFTVASAQGITQEPSSAPSSELVKSLSRPFDRGYMSRLESNLDTGNTECQEVTNAMLQKTLAEEAAITSHMVFDEIIDLSRGHEGNADTERIKVDALMAHLKVQEESAKAAAAAQMVSDLCTNNGQYQIMVEELDAAITATFESRAALSEVKTARDEMEEVVSLLNFDPTMSELEATFEEDEAILVEHLNSVEAEIDEVDSQLEALPDTAPEGVALGNKRGSLVEEEQHIEGALSNEEQFVISQSALKKDEFYESVAPDFVESPPLQYILRSRQADNDLTVETNWDGADEIFGSKEAWFRRFGSMLVVEIPNRLMLSHSPSKGGCIPEDTDLSIAVVITELETVWEQLVPPQCSTGFLMRGPGRDPRVGATSEHVIGGPIPSSSQASPTELHTCEDDVCTDICAMACTDDSGVDVFGTFVQEYNGLKVQCCVSHYKPNSPFKKQCFEEKSGKLGMYRYDGTEFSNEADVDLLCCIGKESCKKSAVTMPGNGVCCRSTLFSDDGFTYKYDEACEATDFISSDSSSSAVSCQGKRACRSSVWNRAGGNVDLCCSDKDGEEACHNINEENSVSLKWWAPPTESPSESPTDSPSVLPTSSPSAAPTLHPSALPTIDPSHAPSPFPSVEPSPSPSSSPTDPRLCGDDVCTDICAMACTNDSGVDVFGTFVQEYNGLTVQCCVSNYKANSPFKKQCFEEKSGKLGIYRYDGIEFGDEADVDVLCCVGKESCKKSAVTMPDNGVCCRSTPFSDDGFTYKYDDACQDTDFISSDSSSSAVSCQGKNACKSSDWTRTDEQVDLCCFGDKACHDIKVGDENNNVVAAWWDEMPAV
jgi:hypothetical protein